MKCITDVNSGHLVTVPAIQALSWFTPRRCRAILPVGLFRQLLRHWCDADRSNVYPQGVKKSDSTKQKE